MKKISIIITLIAMLFYGTTQVSAIATTNCTETGDVGQDIFVRGTVNYIYNGQNKSATKA